MVNYLDSGFVDDIVKRVYGWQDWHFSKSKERQKNQLGLFATVSTYMPHCRNTGIYEKEDSTLHATSEIVMLYPGFNWTEETVRQRTVEYLKELQAKVKEDSLKEDFDD